MSEWAGRHKDWAELTPKERQRLKYELREAMGLLDFEPPIQRTPWEQYLIDKELDD